MMAVIFYSNYILNHVETLIDKYYIYLLYMLDSCDCREFISHPFLKSSFECPL